MNREQPALIVRAAATITGDGDIVIIGSQAILGAADVGWLPEEATMSMEADLAFRNDLDAAKADAVDGAIGELSNFHETYGYYAQGVEIRTAVLPAGWEHRAEILDRADSRPGFARCLEPHDLVVSKLVAGREKDISYARALIGHGIVKAEILHERAEMLAQPKAVVRRVRALILRYTPRQ